MGEPNLEGYVTFLRDIAGLNTTVLPDNSPVIAFSYNLAINICIDLLSIIPQIPGNFLYTTAVYNLATDTLFTYAQDQPNQTYFAQVQQKYQLHSLVPGVISFAGDEGTQSTMVVPDAFKHMTIANLQNLKTPYGRTYLSIVQDVGSLSLLGIQ